MFDPYHAKLARALDRRARLLLIACNDILTSIAEGKTQPFMGGDSWVVTKIVTLPTRARLARDSPWQALGNHR